MYLLYLFMGYLYSNKWWTRTTHSFRKRAAQFSALTLKGISCLWWVREKKRLQSVNEYFMVVKATGWRLLITIFIVVVVWITEMLCLSTKRCINSRRSRRKNTFHSSTEYTILLQVYPSSDPSDQTLWWAIRHCAGAFLYRCAAVGARAGGTGAQREGWRRPLPPHFQGHHSAQTDRRGVGKKWAIIERAVKIFIKTRN